MTRSMPVNPARPRSRAWRIGRLAILALGAVQVAWIGVLFSARDQRQSEALDIIARSVERGPGDDLALRAASGLDTLLAARPGLWFVVTDGGRRALSRGEAPPVALAGGALRCGGEVPVPCAASQVDTPAGRLWIATGPGQEALPSIGMALAPLLLLADVIAHMDAGCGWCERHWDRRPGPATASLGPD